MTIIAAVSNPSEKAQLTPEDVPLREGPPTREELLVHYPAKFTWTQMKAFVNSGDLGLLKRDRKLQVRYDTWAVGIRARYGSMVNYLLAFRLQWGQPDRRALLPSVLEGITAPRDPSKEPQVDPTKPVPTASLPEIPPDAPPYFTADAPPGLISVIMNDWPYSVPPEIEHVLIWTRLPIVPTDLPPSLVPRVHQDGLWGFTGNTSPPPSPSVIPQFIHALSDWGMTVEKMIRSPKGTDEEEEAVRHAGRECEKFIKERWVEREWETAWFVNPPRLQSVPGLAHIHVFVRHKSPEEIAGWH